MLLEDEELTFIFGIIILVIFILYMISFIIRATTDDYPEKCRYLDLREYNNGDVMCVGYHSISGAIITSASNSIWSHTGIIWVDPITNVRYVLEGAIYKLKQYQHFFKIPLETWLFFNKKHIIGYKKYHGPEIDSNYLWDKFEWLTKNCKLEPFNIFWSRFLVNKQYYEYSKKDKYTCLEATVIIGQNAGIYKKDKIYCSYFPGNIANNEISLCEGVFYDLPVQVKLHPANMLILKEDHFCHNKFWKNEF